MRRGIAVLALAAVAGLAAAQAEAQSTSRRTFTSSASSNSTSANCSLRVRSNTDSTLSRRSFVARPRNHALSVSAVNGVNPALNNANVDTTFAAASTLLQAAQNPPADVSCCVSITRTGNLGNFAQPAGMVGGVISNQAELNGVNAVGANLMIVNGITFCGQVGTYVGCRPGGGNLIVIRAQMNAANSATVAHELGHREGLCHTGSCPCGQCGSSTACTCAGGGGNSRDVMFCRTCPNQDTISAAECSSYQANATQ